MLRQFRLPARRLAHTAAKTKEEGTIASVFASLSGEAHVDLPPRFAELKRRIVKDERKLERGWQELLNVLKERKSVTSDAIPQVEFSQLGKLEKKDLDAVKRCGTVVVKGVVTEEEALKWTEELKAYIAANPQVKGFPENDKQVFELYWSKPQLAARSHPNLLSTQTFLSSLFHSRLDSSTPISLSTPLAYADRLRMRHPGDAKFALGPHVDGGSLERWEDESYRSVYGNILGGNWREHDPYDLTGRVVANSDLYNGPGQCGVMRTFQGWLSLSHTGPSEGTLQVYPDVLLSTSYILMRPFFEPRNPLTTSREAYLDASNWRLALDTPHFPNSAMGRGQELNDVTHPHLNLDQSMVSAPRVAPGDMVFWHADVVHAVESKHRGKGDSSVMYIPSAPLTPMNLAYILRQKRSFLRGSPPEDFPGGVGETDFKGHGLEGDIKGVAGRRAMGLEPFDETAVTGVEREALKMANQLIAEHARQ